MGETNVKDLQATCLGFVNVLLKRTVRREIAASAFVSTLVLSPPSPDNISENKRKKAKTEAELVHKQIPFTEPCNVTNFNTKEAITFLSEKYPSTIKGIIARMAQTLVLSNNELVCRYVVKYNGNFHRGFRMKPVSSPTDEVKLQQHMRLAWSILAVCVTAPEPGEVLSLFYVPTKMSTSTRANFIGFFFWVKTYVCLLTKESERACLETQCLKEFREFETVVSTLDYTSDGESSENDDEVTATVADEFQDLENLGIFSEQKDQNADDGLGNLDMTESPEPIDTAKAVPDTENGLDTAKEVSNPENKMDFPAYATAYTPKKKKTRQEKV
jgi:hypothetical protein